LLAAVIAILHRLLARSLALPSVFAASTAIAPLRPIAWILIALTVTASFLTLGRRLRDLLARLPIQHTPERPAARLAFNLLSISLVYASFRAIVSRDPLYASLMLLAVSFASIAMFHKTTYEEWAMIGLSEQIREAIKRAARYIREADSGISLRERISGIFNRNANGQTRGGEN